MAWPADVEEAAKDPSRLFGPDRRYVLLSELGAGGMGKVWRAYDTNLNRPVAIKGVHTPDPEFFLRFSREARVMARLHHPGIVSVFDVVEWEGARHIVMEFVDGQALDRAKPAGRDAARVLRDAARAVHHAHESGVLHRDLKPANIMLDREGRVRVMDFGLAREVTPGATEQPLTVSGAIFGTPSFMAPEQAQGRTREIDARTDVYGLGATLYFLLSGRLPHDGPTAFEILRRVVDEEPPVPAGDPELAKVCQKAIEKDPARRYASAADLAEDLDRFLRGEPVTARPASWAYRMKRRAARNPAAWIAGALAAALLLALVATWGVRRLRLSLQLSEVVPQADAAYEAGEIEAARRLYERVVTLDPSDGSARDRLADCERRVREIDRLMGGLESSETELRIETWNAIIELNPKKAAYWRERGLCRLRRRQYDEAEADLRRAIELDPGDAHAYIWLWTIYNDARHDPEEARRLLAEAMRADPDRWALWLSRANEHAERREYADAVEAMDRVLEARPRFASGYVTRGLFRLRTGDLDGAMEDYEAGLRIDPGLCRAHIGIAEVLRGRGMYADAEREARLAVQLDPVFWGARDTLGGTLLDLGRHEEAGAELDAAVETAPPQEPLALAHRALLRIVQERWDGARADADAALDVDPRQSQALTVRGRCRERDGDAAGAEADFRAALEADPSSLNAASALGYLLTSTGRAEEALAPMEALVQRRPWDAEAYIGRAAALYTLGRYADAEADYRRALTLRPESGESLFGVGLCRLDSHDAAGAIEAFAAAVEAGYMRAYYNLGACKAEAGDLPGAREAFEATLRLDTDPGRRGDAQVMIERIDRALGDQY